MSIDPAENIKPTFAAPSDFGGCRMPRPMGPPGQLITDSLACRMPRPQLIPKVTNPINPNITDSTKDNIQPKVQNIEGASKCD